jgi:hypothetical protein
VRGHLTRGANDNLQTYSLESTLGKLAGASSVITLWQAFWTLMIFASLAWYAALLFYVGWHGGREILEMAQRMKADSPGPNPEPPPEAP